MRAVKVSEGAQAGWVENRPQKRSWSGADLRGLWASRELAFFLAQRDLKVRYKQTLFGVAWAVLQPLAAAVIFSVLLHHFGGLSSGQVAYPVFVFAGLTAWTYVSAATAAAASVLVDNRSLVTRIYFPRLLAPVASVLPALVDFAISLVFVVLFMAIYGATPGVGLLLLPVWIAALVAIALGAGLWFSALNVQYRDVRHALPFVLEVWMFASPVVYTASIVTGWLQWLYAANPMVGALEGFRWSLLGASPPPASSIVSLVVGVLLLVGGVLYFQASERRFADVI